MLVCVLSPPRLHAGAWTQNPGHGQIILTSSFFQTSQNFDASGAAQKFADQGRFRQFLVDSYLELGLTQRSTLVLHVPAPFLDYSNAYGPQHGAGLGDVEIGFKRRFNSVESSWALSGQLTVAAPAYSALRDPAPGNHQEDVEARFLMGHGSTLGQRHAFWDAEAAYRYRSGAPADQFRADLTAGLDLTRRVMVMGQAFVIQGLRNGQPLSASSNPNAQSDFDLYKGEISLVLNIGHGMKVQAGWSDAFAGRNTGRGQTAILGLWKSF